MDVLTLSRDTGQALGCLRRFTSGKKEMWNVEATLEAISLSNTLAPSIQVHRLKYLTSSGTTALRDKLEKNTKYFRDEISRAGFEIKPGDHPIVPVMLYEASLAQDFADRLLQKGIYVIGFFFPVVPKGQARIRVQISAAHEQSHLDSAIEAFSEIGKELGVLKAKFKVKVFKV